MLSKREMNGNCSFDNGDSQDEKLLLNSVNANRDCGTTCGQTTAYPERPFDSSKHQNQTVQSFIKRFDLETADVFNGERRGNRYIDSPCSNGLQFEDRNDIDERDVEWTPAEADRPLAYPKQLVSECKKVGKLLRYLTTNSECRNSPELILGEDEERYADSYDEVQLKSDTSAMFRLKGRCILSHNAEALEKRVCDSSMTITSYQPRETSDEDSAASTLRLLEESPSLSLLSSWRSRDSDVVCGTNIIESIVHASSSIEDTTITEDSLENDSSSSNTSYDSESGSQLSVEETITFPDTFSKSTSFCPFSRSPPEVPSDTSISESRDEDNYVYSELNSRLPFLNSNSRDEPTLQSVHYFNHRIEQKAPYNSSIKHPISGNQSFLAKDVGDINISAKKNSHSHFATENRNSACPQNTNSDFQHNVSKSRQEITNENKTADQKDKLKDQSSQTKGRELVYLFAIRQNMKNLYAKLADACQANKKPGNIQNNSAQRRPPTNFQEPTTKTKRADEVTLQYYREVCYFPPNDQYQSMKTCLGKTPVPNTPNLVQGRRHSLLDFARRFSGAKHKTTPQPKAAPEENRKLSLSDALTMIGDGYSEDYIEDKLDSSAKKMFLEMKKVNFGIRQFPRSSVEENFSTSKQMESHLNLNNSLSDVNDTAMQVTGRVVDSLQDGLKQIGRDSLQNGLTRIAVDTVLAENTVQQGLVELAENTLQKGLVQLAENTALIGLSKLQQHTPFSLSQTFESFESNRLSIAVTSGNNKQLLAGINLQLTNSTLHSEMPCDLSNNATDDSVGTKAKLNSAPIVDTMLDVSPLPIAHVRGAVPDPGIPPCAPESCDRKRIISSLSRYYHVFREGELEDLILDHVPSLLIVDTYYDHANWCVVAEKV